MNSSLIILEIVVALLALGVLLLDLWTPAEHKRKLGYAAAGAVALVLIGSFWMQAPTAEYAFAKQYVMDDLALFFKRFFMLAAIVILVMSVDFADRIEAGISEFYSLVLFALTGMLFAASANDFVMVFVSLELITVTFYVLTSFQRRRLASLEAGVKYLILGALSSAFLVYGIALVFGTAGSTEFGAIAAKAQSLSGNPVFLAGLLLVLAGLAFKIAAFPFQVWAPDVYQGSPAPATAFLAVGSKAAGVALLLRVVFTVMPQNALDWTKILMAISALTILYGNLCAIPQRNLKRLLGYSSIAHGGYILLGVCALNAAGSSAILYYLSGYLFTVLAALIVISVVMRNLESEDISGVAGLHSRSPLLANSLAMAMISLAGIPPLAGFFGKFLLLKAVLERGGTQISYLILIAIALVGVVISFYYYLGVVRAIYWSKSAEAGTSKIAVSAPMRISLYVCMAGMLYLGVFPNALIKVAAEAVKALKL